MVRFINFNQFEVLRNAELFITHGGINSIKESIYALTPMLVYPLNMNWDQPGNAIRIETLGLGSFGDIRNDTRTQIDCRISSLLQCHDLQSALLKFKNIDQKYDSDYLERILLDLVDIEIRAADFKCEK